jgi:hypothetical protein
LDFAFILLIVIYLKTEFSQLSLSWSIAFK